MSLMTISISARDTFRDDEPLSVKVALTYEGTDKHAFNKQVPNIALSIGDEDSPDTTTDATLTYSEARELGNALIALAAEADAWHNKIERNN